MSFNFDFTLDKLSECIPHNKEPKLWFDALTIQLDKNGITTLEEVAGFIAQCQHESLDFTVLSENLNYGLKGLRKVFKRYFATEAIAAQYQRNPPAIANRVYANRMGNGTEKSGDGWKYRGRGILQITGRNNYIQCSNVLFQDDTLVRFPDKLLEPEIAIASACWYWNSRNINDCCNQGDIKTMTMRVNGGVNGLEERVENWQRALRVLKG
jgi:putative chitinase